MGGARKKNRANLYPKKKKTKGSRSRETVKVISFFRKEKRLEDRKEKNCLKESGAKRQGKKSSRECAKSYIG